MKTTINRDFNADISPIHIDQVRDQIRTQFLSGRYWIVIFSAEAAPVVQRVFSKHYRGCTHEAFQIYAFGEPHKDAALFCGVMAKSKMSARQYNRVLERFHMRSLTDSELRRRDIWNIASDKLFDAAVNLGTYLLARETDEPATPEELAELEKRTFFAPTPAADPYAERVRNARWN